MGTSLTGLTPSTTYDALIKVGDNGALSATAKVLSDGLGNDSVLALSTSQVGVGTASPAAPLNVNGSSGADFLLSRTSAATSGVLGTIRFGNQNVDSNMSAILAEQDGANDAANLIFSTQATGGATTERMRITSAGNVGINLSNPVQKFGVSDGTNAFYVTSDANGPYLQAVNNANTVYKRQTYDAIDHVFLISANERARFTANGLTFNGDTAAANALDDYEEGTFTATLKGGTTDPTTPVTTTATYTKIGRQVQINIFFDNVTTTGASGDVIVSGLPFTSSATTMRFSGSVSSFNFTFTGTSNAVFMGNSSTQFEILSSITNGSWSNMSHLTTGSSRFLVIGFTYFV